MPNVEERVKKIIVEQLGVKDDEVTNSASFVDDLGADSSKRVKLMRALKEEFRVEIEDEEITTVQEAIDYINSHITPEQRARYSSSPAPAAAAPHNSSIARLDCWLASQRAQGRDLDPREVAILRCAAADIDDQASNFRSLNLLFRGRDETADDWARDHKLTTF